MKPLAPLALLILLAATPARADLVTADFEGQYPGPDATAVDFRSTGGSFADAGFTFTNSYTPSGGGFPGYYEGFGVSSKVDNVLVNDPLHSTDFAHEFGAYAPRPSGAPGTGSGGSATYGVVFNDFVGAATIGLPTGQPPVSIDIANTTYGASSIRYGDQFSAPIAAGQYVRLDILGLDAAGNTVGTVPFYLADDRSGTLALVDHFTTVNLSSLRGASTLEFDFVTNITNQFGPSVPFTFAVDNVMAGVAAVPEPSGLLLLVAGALGFGLRARRKSAA